MTSNQNKEKEILKCRWSKTMYVSCRRKPVLEMESLTGNWSPICNYHLKLRQRNNDNNFWGALFEIKTRPLQNL